MTGGQHVEGGRSLGELARMLLVEGVEKVVVTTDDVRRTKRAGLPREVSVRDRRDVLDVQRELATVRGVTVMVHDQPCATELRRARKSGLVAKPGFRVVINERVCEGCGDCQSKSNCLSLQTVDTAFGPKTRIDESTCNTDLSCLEGDCPAFTLVKGVREIPDSRHLPVVVPRELADPGVTSLRHPMSVRFAGIGGTGVVTVAHLLARAALIDGLDVWGVDQTGMSQKAGSVVSDLRIGPGASDRSNILGDEEIDLFMICDLMAAAHPSSLRGASSEHTVVVGSTASSLSGPMVLGALGRRMPVEDLVAAVQEHSVEVRSALLNTSELVASSGLPGSTANVALLGVAAQRGLLPVSVSSLCEAIEQNGVAVADNLAAFDAGRRWVADISPPGRAGMPVDELDLARLGNRLIGLDDQARAVAAERATELVAYQGEKLANRYLDLVERVWLAESRAGGDGSLTSAVTAAAFKLLAYKDEYEVARLLLDAPSAEGPTTWLLHPPMLRALGMRRKLRLGPWARPLLRMLRAARRLRGTALDLFGKTELRRMERELADEYFETMDALCAELSGEGLERATAVAALPSMVRGYEGVKLASIDRYRSARSVLLDESPAGDVR